MQLESDLKKAKYLAANRLPVYAVVPFEGMYKTNRRPIYIECRGDSIILQPEGIVFTPTDFLGPGGPSNPLASALRSAQEYWRNAPRPSPDIPNEPYPLLLVRPDGIIAYYLVRDAMSSWDAEFGYELVGQDWQLDFPMQPDPQLKEMEIRAVADARKRLEWLAQASPEAFSRKSSKVQYHVSPFRGGAVRDGGPSLGNDPFADDPLGGFGRSASAGNAGGGMGNRGLGSSDVNSGGAGNGVVGNGSVGNGGIGNRGIGNGVGNAGGNGAFPMGGGFANGGMNNSAGNTLGSGGLGGGGPDLGGVGGGNGFMPGGGNGTTQTGGGNNMPSSGGNGMTTNGGGGYPNSSAAGGPSLEQVGPRYAGMNGAAGGTGNAAGVAGTGGGISGTSGGGPAGPSSGDSKTSSANQTGGTPLNPKDYGYTALPGNSAGSAAGPNSGLNGSAATRAFNQSATAAGMSGASPGTFASGATAGSSSSAGGMAGSMSGSATSSGGMSAGGGSDSPTGGGSMGQTASSSGDPNQASSAGMPSLSFDMNPQQQQQAFDSPPQQSQSSSSSQPSRSRSAMHYRGKDWALPNMHNASMPVERSISVQCWNDRLVLLPDTRDQQAQVIPLGDRTDDAVDELVAAVRTYTKSWGMAGRGMYWKPQLLLSVNANAEARAADLQALLANSGWDVKRR
jgi:hypothetical protein